MNWLVLLLTLVAAGADSVVERVFARIAEKDRRSAGVDYDAVYRYEEHDLRAGTSSVLGCTRRVSWRRGGRQEHTFLTVTAGGRELRGRERERAVADLRRKGLMATNSRMPFFIETREDYEYSVIASGTCRDRDAWIVGFEPKSPSDRTVRGRAWVLKDSFDVVRMDFLPARLPFVVTDASMVLDYDRVDGWWVPVRFALSMELRLKVIIELMRRRIAIEDVYRDHRFAAVAVPAEE